MEKLRDSPFFTTGETGLYLNPQLTSCRVRQLISEGKLNAFRTAGGKWLVSKASLLEFIEQRQRRQATQAREIENVVED